jgi:hypothetical protein
MVQVCTSGEILDFRAQLVRPCSIGVRAGLWPAAGMRSWARGMRSWARGVQRVKPGKECGVMD